MVHKLVNRVGNGPGRCLRIAKGQTMIDLVEEVVAPAAIERALGIYQQLRQRDQSVVLQARKILTQHIFGMVDQGVQDEQRLTVGGLIHLKAIERDHAIKSAKSASQTSKTAAHGAKQRPSVGLSGDSPRRPISVTSAR